MKRSSKLSCLEKSANSFCIRVTSGFSDDPKTDFPTPKPSPPRSVVRAVNIAIHELRLSLTSFCRISSPTIHCYLSNKVLSKIWSGLLSHQINGCKAEHSQG